MPACCSLTAPVLKVALCPSPACSMGEAPGGDGDDDAAVDAGGGGGMDAEEREWLLADKQQQLVEELLEVR